jgi:uncharacterized membrane protein YhaH (DUF805 family)
MTFQESIKTCFTKYADFSGRATRSEYWWFILFIFLGGFVLSFVSFIVYAIFVLATIIPSISAATRRLHDTGRSGWWQLIVLVPLVGWIIAIVFLAQEGKIDAAYY